MPRTFRDWDRDGRDDETGLTNDEWTRRYAVENVEEVARRGAAQDAQRAAEESERYRGSGERSSDLYSGGRSAQDDPEDAAQSAYDETYRRTTTGQSGGGSGGGGGNEAGLSDFDRTSADIPLWGWLTGAGARRDAARAQDAEDRNRQIWDDLDYYMPTPEDLTLHEEQIDAGPLERAAADRGSIEAQGDVLGQLTDIYDSGGLTAADRARLAQGEREMGRAMRSQRDADMAALRARGMADSGTSISSMFNAQQRGANLLADREAGIQDRAERRAMEALAGAGSLSSSMRGQSFDESAWNAGAGNDYNRWNTDYLRDRERRRAQSESDAYQQNYENRVTQTSGKTGQYQGDQSRREREGERSDDRDRDLAGMLAEIVGL